MMSAFMDPNIYLNAIVFYRLAQRDQKQKAVPEPEFRRFDLTDLTVVPEERDHWQNTSRPGVTPHNVSDLPQRKCRPRWPLSSSSYSP